MDTGRQEGRGKMALITPAELSHHNTTSSLWVVRDGRVYDVTDFVVRHPGGAEVLTREGGRDVGEVMGRGGPHDHSRAAIRILDTYHIGDLQSDSAQTTCNSVPEDKNQKTWVEEDLIDWSKPLVWQVGRLGGRYMEWVHSPVDKEIRFFYSDWLEQLTMCCWWVVPVVWLPVMLAFLHASYTNFRADGPEICAPHVYGGVTVALPHIPFLFVAGAVSWSFKEYVTHRWLFHLRPPAHSPLLITLHFLIHGQHHKAPMDKNRLVFPPVPASLFAIVFWLMYTSLLPRATAQAVLSGLTLGYMYYDIMHYYLHHGAPQLNYFLDLKHYHLQHHYSHQNLGFGISCKFWDFPFRTVIPKDNNYVTTEKDSL